MKEKKIRLKDIIVIVVCILGMAVSFSLFLHNWNKTFVSRDNEVGTITSRRNSVQRQQEKKALWERLTHKSPVYSGDLIRTAADSEAVIDIDRGQIKLNENTMIRIQITKDIPKIEYHFGLVDYSGDPEKINIVDDKGRKLEDVTGKVEFLTEKTETAGSGTIDETADLLPFTIIEQEPEPLPVLELLLESPAAGAELEGLKALREPTIFRWSATGEAGRYRFILSRNSDPFEGRPAREVTNPGPAVRLDRLEAGIWYWTVEAWTPDGVRFNTAEPRQLRVLAIPLLPEASNRRPANGHHIAAQELKGGLGFSWSAVSGANAYIVSLFQQTNNGRREIAQSGPITQTRWVLNDITLLKEQGDFAWQVEAVNRDSDGTIDQHGRMGRNTFIVNIPILREGTIEVEVLDIE